MNVSCSYITVYLTSLLLILGKLQYVYLCLSIHFIILTLTHIKHIASHIAKKKGEEKRVNRDNERQEREVREERTREKDKRGRLRRETRD